MGRAGGQGEFALLILILSKQTQYIYTNYKSTGSRRIFSQQLSYTASTNMLSYLYQL